jgi:hypothetical protein
MPASAVRTCAKTRHEEGLMDGNASGPRFPLPSEITDAPGAEGWRSMYPYFTRFQPEDDKRFWFYNSMHFPEPMPAFDTITAEVPYSAIGANTGDATKRIRTGQRVRVDGDRGIVQVIG